jgi:hypothetical protein
MNEAKGIRHPNPQLSRYPSCIQKQCCHCHNPQITKVVPISIFYLHNASFPVSSMLKGQTKLK